MVREAWLNSVPTATAAAVIDQPITGGLRAEPLGAGLTDDVAVADHDHSAETLAEECLVRDELGVLGSNRHAPVQATPPRTVAPMTDFNSLPQHVLTAPDPRPPRNAEGYLV